MTCAGAVGEGREDGIADVLQVRETALTICQRLVTAWIGNEGRRAGLFVTAPSDPLHLHERLLRHEERGHFRLTRGPCHACTERGTQELDILERRLALRVCNEAQNPLHIALELGEAGDRAGWRRRFQKRDGGTERFVVYIGQCAAGWRRGGKSAKELTCVTREDQLGSTGNKVGRGRDGRSRINHNCTELVWIPDLVEGHAPERH